MNGNANHNPGLEVSCKVLCCLNNVPSVRFSNWIKKKKWISGAIRADVVWLEIS